MSLPEINFSFLKKRSNKIVIVFTIVLSLCFTVFDRVYALPTVVRDASTAPEPGGFFSTALFRGVRYITITTPENGTEIWTTDGTEAGTTLFKDLTLNSSSGPTFFSLGQTDNLLFFSATTREYGTELWVTDGTVGGTRMVKDIRLANASGLAGSGRTVLGSNIYFSANDGNTGIEVWKSDGTEGGTVLVKDLWSDFSGGYVSGAITPFGGNIYYFGNVDGAGGSLIRSDGTALGTYSLGTYPTFTTARTVIGSYMYMSGGDDTNGRELWRSDGTALGTELIKDINPGIADSLPTSFTNYDGTVFYFTATTDTHGTELWKSDGTEVGTVLVKDINPGASGSAPANIRKIGSYMYFSANDGVNGLELWRTDGTELGTVLVKDINPGANGSSIVVMATTTDNVMYMAASDGSTGLELWKTDGTAEGTVMIKDIDVGIASSSPSLLYSDNDVMYFSIITEANGRALWKTDGTADGTVAVKDITGTNSSVISLDTRSDTNELIFFLATSTSPNTNSELWKTDGTTEGTTHFKDIYLGPNGSRSVTGDMLKIDSTTFFSATDATNGTELWKTDGTSLGTVLVKDIRSGSSSSNPRDFIRLGSLLVFTATDGTNGIELWKSDGTSGGTVMIKDIRSGSADSSPRAIVAASSSLYFFANNGTSGEELWRTDGTTDGTYMIRDIYSGSNNGVDFNQLASLKNYTINGDIFIFEGLNSSQSGLWRSDGTSDGTFLIKDYGPSGSDTLLNMVTTDSGVSYVIASNNPALSDDFQLWKTDGTVDGTVFLKDLDGVSITQAEYNAYKLLTAADTRVYFSVEKSTSTGFEIWTSDGTSAGTYMIKDINPGTASGVATDSNKNLVTVGDVAFFQGMNEEYGAELWKTDGTEEGTYILDIFPGSGSSVPSELLVTNNETELYMTAVSPGVGRELMRLPLTSTVTLSSVTTSSITKTSATVSSGITDVGFSPAHTRGFNYGTSLSYGMSTSTQGRYSLGTYEYTLTDLTCNTTYYVEAFAVNTYGTTTQTTSFTTSACSSSSTPTPPSSGGGGGGSRVSTPLPTVVSGILPPASANAVIFTRDLTLTAQGTDVYALQRFLNARGHTVANTGAGSPGNETSIFGSLTRLALARFQTSVGITPATGYFGPLTRAFINKLGATPPKPATVQTTPTVSSPTTYTRDLTLESTGSDVTALQTYLIQQGYLQSGYATGYFGVLTQSALIKFQQANNITPALGYFGPKTREVVGR